MNKKNQKLKRKLRTRGKIFGTKEKPRISVFRSNKYIYAQLINDEDKKTILGVSEKDLEQSEIKKINKTEKAKKLGILLAKKTIDKKIKNVVFDKGCYSYHGRVKNLAQGAREGGLNF